MLSRRFDRVTRFTRRDAVRLAVVTILLVGGLTAILSIGDLPQAYNLQEGSVAPQQIRAPRAIRFESTVQTAAARQAAADTVEPQYDFGADTASSLARRQLETLATALAPVDAAFAGQLTPAQRSTALKATLAGDLLRRPEDARRHGRRAMVAGRGRGNARARDAPALRAARLGDGGRATQPGWALLLQLTDDERGLATEIVDPLLVPNSTYSAELTAAKRQAAADAVVPVEVGVAKGEVLIDAGRKVTAADIEKLEALGLTEARLDIARIAGWFLLAALVVILYLAWLWRYRQELWHRARTLALLGLVLLVTAFAYKLTAGRSILPFFVPGAGAGMLVAILLGAGPATVLSFFLAVIAGASNDLSLELATYVFVGSLTGILAVRRGDRVAVFIQAGVAIAVANVVVVSIFSLLGTRDITGVLQLFGASAAAAAGAAVATVGTFQVVGNLFGILTVFQLLELANPSQALLRRLLLETPGTYHHSLMVGNLAERAAEAIGADPLLARVAAYYHDVGKLENPGRLHREPGRRGEHPRSPDAGSQRPAPEGARLRRDRHRLQGEAPEAADRVHPAAPRDGPHELLLGEGARRGGGAVRRSRDGRRARGRRRARRAPLPPQRPEAPVEGGGDPHARRRGRGLGPLARQPRRADDPGDGQPDHRRAPRGRPVRRVRADAPRHRAGPRGIRGPAAGDVPPADRLSPEQDRRAGGSPRGGRGRGT